MSGKNRYLTQRERILLLLSQFDSSERGYVVPYQLCQDGMSEALDMLKNNVSRELSKLKEEGLVGEELSRVKNKDRRRKTYHLTEDGEKAVEDIKGELKKEKVPLKDSGKRPEDVTLNDATQRLRKVSPNISLFYVEEWMRKKDVLDMDEFHLPSFAEKDKERTRVERVVTVPTIEELYGREEEVSELKENLGKGSPPIVVVTGLAGVGKSSLAAKVLEKIRGDKDIFWYTFHRWENKSGLIDAFNQFLKKAGKPTLDVESSLSEAVFDLFNSTSDLKPVIFLDNCEKVPKEMKNLFELLLVQKKRGADFCAVLIGREQFDFYDVRDLMNDLVLEIELEPLDIGAVKQMVSGDVEEIYQRTKGHPLYVELYNRYSGRGQKMKDFIQDEIYSSLDAEDKEILKRLSLFWDPIESEVALKGDEPDRVIQLKKNHLIEETQDGKIGLHSILRDFFHEHISSDRRKEIHKQIAEMLDEIEEKDESRKLEMIYHYERGGLWEKALDSMEDSIKMLGRVGEQVRKELLEGFSVQELSSGESKSRYHEMAGDIYLEAEDWGSAALNYKKVVEMGEDTTLLREKLGEAQMELEEWENTVRSHKKALELYKKKGDPQGLAREYLSLGRVYRRKGELEKAEEHYDKVKHLIEEADIDVQGPLYNNYGMLHLQKESYNEAKENFQKALKTSDTKGVVYENLALLYQRMKDLEEANRYLKDAIDSYEKKGELKKAIELYIKCAAHHEELGREDKAVERLKEALELEKKRKKSSSFWPLRRSRKISDVEIRLRDRLADLLTGESSFTNRREVIKAQERRGEKESAARSRLKLAFDLHEEGLLKEALQELDDVKRTLDSLGIEKGVTAIELEEARVYRDLGKYERAKKLLESVREGGESRGDSKAVKQAEMLLQRVLGDMGR